MARPSRDPTDDLLVAADVLGSFGVTATDLAGESAEENGLEDAVADVLSTGVDRTTVLRRTIARSDRGIACAARYSRADLEAELEAAFEAIGWSLAGSATPGGLELTATDPHGRSREATVTYPETPLASDNLPAVLWTITETVLAGTDARFILLSSGVDRWRAVLAAEPELERLRERYGPRIEAFDRPLCPEYGLAAYVPGASPDGASALGADSHGFDPDADPWPPWALEYESHGQTDPDPGSVDSLIEDAEPSSAAATDSTQPSTSGASTSDERREIDGFELRGEPSVSRTRPDDGSTETSDSGRSSVDSSRRDRSAGADESSTRTTEFGTLSGSTTTTRVENDSFGTDLDPQSEDDRYRAVGAALDAGGTVSVRGLLEDDEFLPELPAVEPTETRIEFDDECAPVEPPDATAAAEESGFEWVETGSLETMRLSDG
ncbi:hypothetical protein [Natrinema ejinorense]